MKAGVFGLEKTGLSVANFLSEQYEVFVWDDRKERRNSVEKKNKFLVCNFLASDFCGINFLVVSPGIPLTHPIISSAQNRGIEVITDIDLFYRDYAFDKNTIIVTGTNGKSTVTSLLRFLLSYCETDKTVHAVGNIGNPVLDYASEKFEKDIFIVELSCYQIDYLATQLSCRALFWLNFSTDHLERYYNIEKYFDAKRRVFDCIVEKCDVIIGSSDVFSQRIPRLYSHRTNFHFSYVQDDSVKDVSLVNLKEKYGMYGYKNIIAVLFFLQRLGYSIKHCLRLMDSYTPPFARGEFIYQRDNFCIINDSKATNIHSCVNTLSRFSKIIWIGGGIPKKGDVENIYLFKTVLDRIMCACLYGNFVHILDHLLKKKNMAVFYGNSLKDSCADAFHFFKMNSDVQCIVFAPACASYDQYRSFEERGKEFVFFVREFLKEEKCCA